MILAGDIGATALVERVDAEGVVVGSERIASRTMLWMAGVMPSPAGQWRWPKSGVRPGKDLGLARPASSQHADTCR
jgi:hypothetical protein